MATPLTGDIKDFTARTKEGVTLHNHPQAPLTNLSDIGAIVNDHAQSGKRLGGQIMGVTVDGSGAVTAAQLFVASGEAPEDPWVFIADIVGTGGTTITPA